jgi:hypothetical protein
MSDPFDALFEGLRGQRPPSPFAPPTAVRRRGRQRANRQAVSIGVAVFAVTGLGAGGIVTAFGQSETPPVPPASPPTTVESPTVTESPALTEVPEEWLLTAEDLGTGWREDTGEFVQGPWYWDGAEPWCPEYRIEDYPSVEQRVDFTFRGWARQGEALLERVDQLVELFEPGAGVTSLDDVRAFIELCSRRPADGDEVAPTFYEIEENGFAGDESLLIRVEQYQFNGENIELAGELEYVAVVRVGDAVTTIRFLNVPDDMQQIAQRAADRLGGE